jgi:16S rRNA processing protein RimM
LIGTIIGAHGVHGWVKVQCTTDFPHNRLCTAGIRHLKALNKRAPREVILLNGKHRLGDEYLIQLHQVNDRDTAQKLRGSFLYIREEQKSYDLNVNEFVVSDLVGLDVYLKVDEDATTKSDKYVGKVAGVVFSEDVCSIPGLGHDYLEINLPRGIGGTVSYRDEMVLVPMVPEIVPDVDIIGRRVLIDPPSGLLDLTYVREEKTRIKGFLPPSRRK